MRSIKYCIFHRSPFGIEKWPRSLDAEALWLWPFSGMKEARNFHPHCGGFALLSGMKTNDNPWKEYV
jgi:hypothetical protein